MAEETPLTTHFSLDNKYTQEEGTIILSGVQALMRIPVDQYKADKAAGLKTATFISGYRGSPLGGYDLLLQQQKELLDAHEIVFIPGVNEDLAATAVLGSQIANLLPQPKYDGVLGIWYGKGPGVDRSGDIFKHAQTTGVGKYGGVLALAGDDPTAKSSTIPSHSEIALYDAQMPVLYPGNVQEVMEYGRLGLEMSRYSGSWVGLKFVTNVADSFETANIRPMTISTPDFVYQGRPWSPTQNPALLAPHSLNQEREIYEGRLEAAKRFAAVNNINQIVARSNGDWIGIICAGKTYYDVMEALHQLGLTGEKLNQYGIRILKIGMLYPIEETILKTFAKGLEQIFVIEEKRAFVEMFVREALYNEAERPPIVGKKDENGEFLVRGDYELDADQIAELLAKRLSGKIPAEAFSSRLNEIIAPPVSISLDMSGAAIPARTPYFCSGCPHNASTVAPEGSLQGGGIGCSTLSILMDRNVTGVTQMGGEGAQWVGASPFSDVDHIFQHIGDGTLAHSGSMAIRQALASKASMTYKILANGAVAMTGGQHADGEMALPELTRALEAEGIVKTIVVSHDPKKFPASTRWAEGVMVWERERLMEAQEVLRDIEGITALIYDQPCATELRRDRKRGKVEDPPMRVMINEEVCEGCGDCGEKSNCLSVFPVETEFGRKTQIHQSSCNKDYSCLKGDCPAFVTVIPSTNIPVKKTVAIPDSLLERLDNLPEPRKLPPSEGNVYMTGIGGTGVVTINQILATAAMIDGKHVNSLDQTGLSQKGGPVVSHIRVTDDKRPMSCMIGKGEADAYVVFDLLSGTTEANLTKAKKGRTVAIVSDSKTPTGTMVRDKSVQFPQNDMLRHRLEMVTSPEQNIYFNAIAISEKLFGSHIQANIMTIGAAYQAGVMPITAVAIEHAIQLNGVSAEKNKRAFRVGRMLAIDPKAIDNLFDQAQSKAPAPELSAEAQTILDSIGADGELHRLLAIRIPELIAHTNQAYAQSYAGYVARVIAAESDLGASQDGRLSQAVARYLFKLMAYKDEYEVARLQIKSSFSDKLEHEFGTAAKVKFMLHPPLLRAMGMKNKIALGAWIRPLFKVLASMKFLRGSAFDIFGKADVRRAEQQLPAEYKSMIDQELATLSAQTYDRAIALAETPDIIRGYEDIKLANVQKFRQKTAEIKARTEPVSGD
ncbi:MAG: indolepyruvate ferredoxin oxidoreductase family protein [Anaerolineae bacterium]